MRHTKKPRTMNQTNELLKPIIQSRGVVEHSSSIRFHTCIPGTRITDCGQPFSATDKNGIVREEIPDKAICALCRRALIRLIPD